MCLYTQVTSYRDYVRTYIYTCTYSVSDEHVNCLDSFTLARENCKYMIILTASTSQCFDKLSRLSCMLYVFDQLVQHRNYRPLIYMYMYMYIGAGRVGPQCDIWTHYVGVHT